ncbi:hypothetical protein CERZMDRAFT_86826 [Cercospora zeae-maydis SCOH1-5]|uniref:BTB domain-containing protein n=1 Tax=Cercospora zeae-maydis SCOH1-5 TaxID=717836 RepID=A0A6A6F6S1_9PEZI|nr:hypothetical protein CERZMDRAFT_86826 [Cercospora zeae-maydis SCOH1-5]
MASKRAMINEADTMRVAKKRRTKITIIDVIVGHGEDTKTFQLQDFLLVEHSEFFKAALNGQWKEGKENKIELPDDEPGVFEIYAEWLFCGRIASGTDENAKPAQKEIWAEMGLLSRLYVLGEKLIDDEFCDCTLRSMVELRNVISEDGQRYLPSGDDVRNLYDGTTQSSPIRKYLVDLYCHNIGKDWFSNDKARHYPKDFFVDIARKGLPLLNGRKRTDPGEHLERYLKCK